MKKWKNEKMKNEIIKYFFFINNTINKIKKKKNFFFLLKLTILYIYITSLYYLYDIYIISTLSTLFINIENFM